MTPRRSFAVLLLATGLVAGACSDGDDATGPSTSVSTPSTTPPSAASTIAGSAVDPERSAALLDAVCTGAARIEDSGTIESEQITEASGLVASWRNSGAWWIHNDSGDSARIFAIDVGGELLGTVDIDGAEARDWEDIAVGPPVDGEAATIYVGDTGDNSVIQNPAAGRGDVRIFRFAEPVIDRDVTSRPVSVEAETLVYEFPDGAHDVEALLVDPVEGDLLVVTKDWQRTGAASVFRGDAEADDGSTTELELVGSVPLEPGTLVTAADVTRDGSLVALRSYGAVQLYERPTGEPLWSAFETTPCEGPVPTETQGESIGFAPDGGSYLTVSEGEQQTLHRTTR